MIKKESIYEQNQKLAESLVFIYRLNLCRRIRGDLNIKGRKLRLFEARPLNVSLAGSGLTFNGFLTCGNMFINGDVLKNTDNHKHKHHPKITYVLNDECNNGCH